MTPQRVFDADFVEDAQVEGAPCVQGDEDADRGRGGIDDVGELLAGRAEAVEQWPGNRSGHEHGDVRLDEDHDPDEPGEKLRAASAVDPPVVLEPTHESTHASGSLDGRDHGPDREREEDDSAVAGVSEHTHRLVDRGGEAGQRVPPLHDHPPDPHPSREGDVDLSAPDGENDGEERREERNPGGFGHVRREVGVLALDTCGEPRT